MADITMCMNDKCEMKESCLRSTAIPNEGWQSWMYYICEGQEWFFIDNNATNSEK